MNALRVCGSSIQVWRVDDAGRDHGLLAGADDRPPAPVGDDADGTPPARSSSSIRSIGLAAQPSSSGSRSESTGSMTQDQRADGPAVDERAGRADGDRVVGRADLLAASANGSPVQTVV